MKTRIPLLIAAAAALASAAPASAAERFTIRGAGFGHGVGMSQWGAYGFAKRGHTHDRILAHYYTGTELGQTGSRRVRVLMQSVAVARFSGASTAAGRRLDPGRTYGVRRGGTPGTVELLSPTGRRMKRLAAPLRVKGSGGRIRLAGRAINGISDGFYRGSLEFRPSGSLGVSVVNAVGLEAYVRGVVSYESPASWPAEALKAQAVAARTYAITTSKGGDGFEQYPDTRSQVYGGVRAETPTTDAAVKATRGQVVTYQGRPVVTYFFSTSGGRTEDVENTSLGNAPVPWLKSVKDPYDDESPKHRWGPIRMSYAAAGRKLSGLVKGSFEGIKVVKRGRSPRIVLADVVGSRGTTRVNGATLRARLGLNDTWAYFTSISTGEEPSEPGEEPPPGDPSGGVPPEARAAERMGRRVAGRVVPARRGSKVIVQMRQGKRRWVRVAVARTDAAGRYAYAVERPGTYRVRYRGDAGPKVRIR